MVFYTFTKCNNCLIDLADLQKKMNEKFLTIIMLSYFNLIIHFGKGYKLSSSNSTFNQMLSGTSIQCAT